MAEEYNVQAIMNALKEKTEMDPDQHDGCYELMRETIEAYSKLRDFSVIDYRDLNLVYLTTVGTWKQGVEGKKKTVRESHLLPEDKDYLAMLWDDIWEKACRGEYSNNEMDANGNGSIGLFGTGFFSFQRTTTSVHAQSFIRMCCDILPMTDDNMMYDRAAKVLIASFQGMRAASASMILHCLKPYSFPVLNSNMGRRNVFEVLGVQLNKRDNIETYIDNCRKIKAFRDTNFLYKNYRIFDIAAWKVAEYSKKHEYGKFGYWEILSESVARLDCHGGELVLHLTNIPSEIRWFFRVSELRTGARQEVVLVHDGFEYDGYFLRESVVPIGIKLCWDEGLSEEFGTPAKTGEEVILEFTRLEDNRFELNLVKMSQSEETKDRAWLITWNKNNWNWGGYSTLCTATENGQSFVESWACVSSKPQIGDEVFLLKLGEEPRGIIGHGKVVREQYEKDHFNPEKAAEGKKHKAINVEFDRLLNYERDKILSQAELVDKCGQQHWSPQGSGIEIVPEVIPILRALWEAVASTKATSEQNSDEWWPSLSEYDPGITADEYVRYFTTESIVKRTWLGALYELYMMPNHASSCKQLSDRYGHSPTHYISYFSSAGQNIQKETGIGSPEDDKNAKYWPILFQGKSSKEGYCYKMREPVCRAMSILMSMGTFLEKENDRMAQFDHNLILYGPPGTGKTYHSAIYAVAICEGRELDEVKKEPYADVLSRYKELKEDGRIAFTTFHQSYGYEEFIEGIKPKLNSENESLGYVIENGVFKEFCKRASAVKVRSSQKFGIKANPHIWGMLLGGTGVTEIKQYCFDNSVIRFGWDHIRDADVIEEHSDDTRADKLAKHQVASFIYSMEVGHIVIIAKSITTIDAIGVIAGEYDYDQTKETHPRTRKVEWLIKNEEIDILPYLPNGRKQLPTSYLYPLDYIGVDTVSRILDESQENTEVYFETETKPYIFIIDEINRGNISKIFGELITLIEDTKRAGAAEAMEAILPYSGEPFSVPNNVYILGTMNTADRSIALMDTALRRRFEFVEMMPNSEVLNYWGVGTILAGGEELNVLKMLDVINERIEYLFDREHTIGHAFFRKLADDPSIETLAGIFEKNVIPLLQEYFYEDYEKIQLVLGDNEKEDEYKFILDEKVDQRQIFKGNPDIDLPTKRYVIQHSAFKKVQSYKLIGKDL